MADSIRIAIASDLHACTDAQRDASHLQLDAPEEFPAQHPITGLEALIEQEKLHADLLLSPGDLGHQANPVATRYAWTSLHRVGARLGATMTVGTAGNHDMDSRFQHTEFAPDQVLKDLVPPFPFGDAALDNQYWARGYAIKDTGDLRLLVLNSSATHGNTEIEKNHGRVTKSTLEKISGDLKATPVRPINVLLCHHHPQAHGELGLGEEDVMKQGQLLLALLGKGEYGAWLVVHGHKHHPKLSYAAGSAMSPVVFAAGSLSSTLYLPLQTQARNQFYVIEVNKTEIETLGLVGKIRAWDWVTGEGWVKASSNSGIDAEIGFGCRTSIPILARQIAALVKTHPDPIEWKTVLAALPEVAFVLPVDFVQLETELKRVHKIKIQNVDRERRDIGVIS